MREIRTSGSVGAAGGNSRGDPTAGGFSRLLLALGGRRPRGPGSPWLGRLRLLGVLYRTQDQVRLVGLKHQLQLDHPARQQPPKLRSRGYKRHLQQLRLVVGSRHSGERANLGV